MNNLQEQELPMFAKNIQQDVIGLVEATDEEEGASLESKFTELMVELLTEAGETANVSVCTEIKEDKLGRKQHKINAYALSETYENVDLFVSIYRGSEHIETIPKDEITTNANLAKRFLNDSMKGNLTEKMEESALVFDLVQVMDKYCQDIIRVNIFILTNGITKADPPKEAEITLKNEHKVLILFHLWDLERFYQLYSSKNKREAIRIDFHNDFGGAIPCLPMPSQNDDYESYLAIMSGETLAGIYRNFGSRLLEQNVRSFLQFSGKINKGIRETIKKEPQMFMAFNNGIASTAEEVELVELEKGIGIGSVKDFQIVNGGQTTASIFHSQKKDKTDLSQIFVQVKLTVIKKKDEFSTIVSRIAKYANSQNKVSDADFSSNSPFHIELEKLSRIIWAPDPTNQNRQTRWFYERARGQYKNELIKEGSTPSRKKAFEIKNPKQQLFQKETLAKFYNAWNGLPHFVAQGNQKNYTEFYKNITKTLKDSKGIPDTLFFEDIIAMAILFRTAEKDYGVGKAAIGDLRFMVVPYSLSYLNHITNQKIDLYKIWKAQAISENLRAVLSELLRKVDDFLRTSAKEKHGGLIGEWAKKEACWDLLLETNFELELGNLKDDFVQANSNRRKKDDSDIENLEKQAQLENLQNVPQSLWKKIAHWGRSTNVLSAYKLGVIEDVARRLHKKQPLEDLQIKNATEIWSMAFLEVPALFLDNEDEELPSSDSNFHIEITAELLEKLLTWGKKSKWFLSDKQFIFVKKIKMQTFAVSDFQKKYLFDIIEKAIKKGFEV